MAKDYICLVLRLMHVHIRVSFFTSYLFNINYCFIISVFLRCSYFPSALMHSSPHSYFDCWILRRLYDFEKGCAMCAVLCLEGEGLGLILGKRHEQVKRR